MKKGKITTADAGARNNLSFKTRHFGKAHVITNAYYEGGNLAVELVDQNGEGMAMLSVNIPESSHLLGKNEFFVKTWSENEEIAKDALASGIFRDTNRCNNGFLRAHIWAFN